VSVMGARYGYTERWLCDSSSKRAPNLDFGHLMGREDRQTKQRTTPPLQGKEASYAYSASTYHRVLNRAVWSSLRASRILLGLLVAAFVPTGPLVVGIDACAGRKVRLDAPSLLPPRIHSDLLSEKHWGVACIENAVTTRARAVRYSSVAH